MERKQRKRASTKDLKKAVVPVEQMTLLNLEVWRYRALADAR